MADIQQLSMRSKWSRLYDPVTPFVIGLGVIVVAIGGVVMNLPFVGGGGFYLGAFNPRGHAWLVVFYVAVLFTLAAGAANILDHRRRRGTPDDSARRMDRAPALGIWIAAVVGALLTAVSVLLVMLITGNSMTSNLRNDQSAMLYSLAVSAAILTYALVTLVLDRRYRRRYGDERNRPAKSTRVASVGLMVGIALLVTSIIPIQFVVPAAEEPPSGSSEVIECPAC